MFFLLDATNPEVPSILSTYFTADTLCTMITVIGSVITVSVTYFKTQKMKQFDVFFSHKTRAYEDFWIAMSTFYDRQDEETRRALRCAVHRIGLYASDETFSQITILATSMIKGSTNIGDQISEISVLMRKDLNKTKRGKLY